MTTDIITVTIKSLNLPRLEDDVIADAEYSPVGGEREGVGEKEKNTHQIICCETS